MTQATTTEHTFAVKNGRVSALLTDPGSPKLVYVLAHGAGAGMRHPFLERVAGALRDRSMATFRYQFPYMEAGKKRPDAPALAEETVRRAVAAAAEALPGVPILAGGKSFGGRMTSRAAADAALPGVRGLAFLGFPLHAPGKPGTERAAHLAGVAVPMLFLAGTRDTLAKLELVREVCDALGDRATLHVIEGGDHSFNVRKKDGRTPEEAMDELTRTLADWATALL